MSELRGPAPKPVLVCVDGGDDGDRALRYAIREAELRQTPLRLLHVPPDVIPYAPMTPLYTTPSLREIGERILKDTLDRALELAPDVPVEAALGHGPRVHAIVTESQGADCLVVGTREWHNYRVFGRSTSVAVATRAACPVIAVPPAWRGDAPLTNRIVVGLDDKAGPGPVLTHAFETARRRRAHLVLVHAWAAPRPYAAELAWLDPDGWRLAAAAQLLELTAREREEFPDVQTQQVVTYDAASNAVAKVSVGSDLVILGRHRQKLPHAHRLGSVARSTLHAGLSPLEIVPVGPPSNED